MKKILVFTLICTAHLINSNITASFSSNAEALEHNRSSSGVVTATAAPEPHDEVLAALAALEFLKGDKPMDLDVLRIINDYNGVEGVFPRGDCSSNFGNGVQKEIRDFKGKNLTSIRLLLNSEHKFGFLGKVIQEEYGRTVTSVNLDKVFRGPFNFANCDTIIRRADQRVHCIARMREIEKFINFLPNLQVFTISISAEFWEYIPKSLGTFFLESSVDSGSQKRLTFTRKISKTPAFPTVGGKSDSSSSA